MPPKTPTLINGVQRAIVIDNNDRSGQARVKIQLVGTDKGIWARVATLMAGKQRGTWFIPEIDDEVLVVFEGGDPRLPFVVGSLWSDTNPPPPLTASERRVFKLIRSRGGVQITFDDTDGQQRLIFETPAGQRIELSDGPGAIKLTDGNGNSVKLEPHGITISAAAGVKVQAGTIEIDAGMVTVNAGVTKFSGVVQADTVISNSIISASYTPGAGNIW